MSAARPGRQLPALESDRLRTTGTLLLAVLAAALVVWVYSRFGTEESGAGAGGVAPSSGVREGRADRPAPTDAGDPTEGTREALPAGGAELPGALPTTWGARLVARESGQRLSGVRVHVILLSPDAASEEATLVSDAQGEVGPIEVRIERHPAAEVRVDPGPQSAALTTTVLFEPGQANHDVLELAPSATLTVQVLDFPREAPVPGARVGLYEASGLIGEATCDARGFARIVWGAAGGPFSVRATAAGYAAVTRGELRRAPEENLELVLLLAAMGTLRVRVQDESGALLAGCRVAADLVEENLGAAPSLSDAHVAPELRAPAREESGVYVLAPLPCGVQFVVTARSEGGPTGHALVEIDAMTRVTEVTVTVAGFQGTNVWTIDARGAPLPEVTIATEEETLGRSDESGHLVLPFQESQQGLELWGFKPGYSLAWQTWSAESQELVFRLTPGESVTGTVVDSAGKPQKLVRITPLLGERDAVREQRKRRGAFALQESGARSTGTDSTGTFALHGLAGTWIDLHVRPPKTVAFEVRDVLIGTEGLLITLPDEDSLGRGRGIALLVQVIDSVSLSPLRGVSVSAFYVPDPQARSYEDSRGGTTDSDGRVRLGYPQEGDYVVTASADGYTSPPMNVVHYDRGEHPVELRLAPAGELELRLLDAGGKGKEGYWIQARDTAGELVPFAHFEGGSGSVSPLVMTDLRGRVIANKMPVGLLTLEVRASPGGPVLTSENVLVRSGERAQAELRLP